MDDQPQRTAEGPRSRQLDMESLKGLAHPLRVQILDVLSVHGQFTASGLAERLGESSGATSYHLRQLERHGFVREVEGRGTGRERWWERMPGGIDLDPAEIEDSPASRAAAKTVLRQWARSRSDLLADFQERGYDVLPPEWIAATVIDTLNLRLTREQLKEIAERAKAFLAEDVEKYRGMDLPGARPVQIHFNAFPVLGVEETPADPAETA